MPRQRGFALLIMLVIVVIGSLYAVTSQLEVASRKYARDEATFRALLLAKEALIGYAATYRDTHSGEVFGYLPCPDTMTGDGTVSGNCGAANLAAVGLFPYKSMGLPDLRDASGNCLWYAVSGTFKNNTKADATVMNWDTQGQFSIADAEVNPDQGDGGAVAVIFAAGPPLAGQNRSASGSNPCQVDPAQVAAYLDGNYSFATSSPIAITQGSRDSASNNDQLMWITPKEIFDKVVKRQDFSNLVTASPPGQINTLTDLVQGALEKSIQDDMLAGSNTISLPTADTTGFTPFPAGRRIGKLPATRVALQSSGPLVDTSGNNYDLYYGNWNEQYRLAMCSDLTPLTPCGSVTVAGTACRGALMFGGRTNSGQPRTSAQKAADSASLGYYFESGSGLDILNSATTTFSGITAYSAASPSADVGTCLFPGTFLSSAQNIAGFSAGMVNPSGATNKAVSVTAGANPSINLGNSALAARSGCVWYATPFALGSTLRLYFNFNIVTAGQGFTLALADQATNNIASTNPYMCGSTTNSRLGYAGTPPSGTTAGIKPPKIGLEFDLATTAATNDYSGHHFAFLYWGKAGDNIPTGTGNDDNTHYFGILGSGSEPVNPYGLSISTASATPVATLSAATWSGGTVSATTTAPHGFTNGQNVWIADVTSTGFDLAAGNPVVATVSATDATHFTYPLAANPGTYTYGTTATRTAKTTAAGFTCSGGTVTVTTTTNPHGFSANQFVNISGVTPVAYNGTFQIVSIVSTTRFTYALGATCPANSTVAGFVNATHDLTSATWASGTVTATTAANHGLGRQINGASWASSTCTRTITTASSHGYLVGQDVNVASVSPANYNGAYRVLSVPNSTSFTITQPLGGSVSPGANQIVYAICSTGAGTSTFTTASNHGYSVGQTVTIAGLSSSDNGTFQISSVPTGSSFTIDRVLQGSDPGSYTSGGWASAGEIVSISGVSPTKYNGTFPVKVTSATQFTYALVTNPGGNFSNTTFATPGFSTVKSPYFPAGGTMPLSSTIHVRLDLTRNYSASAHQATFTLKAYVDNLFPVADVCSATDFQNLARDLSALCPLRTPTLEQDNVVINDVIGPALANIYVGFTTARGSTAADNQNISIYNVMLRSQ